MVKVLLKEGANIEEHNENGHTALMEAASAGHVEVARILLENGAGINTHSNEFKESALTLACYKGSYSRKRSPLNSSCFCISEKINLHYSGVPTMFVCSLLHSFCRKKSCRNPGNLAFPMVYTAEGRRIYPCLLLHRGEAPAAAIYISQKLGKKEGHGEDRILEGIADSQITLSHGKVIVLLRLPSYDILDIAMYTSTLFP